MAHEINNPLAFVTANLQHLAEVLARGSRAGAEPFDDDLREALREAIEGCRRIQTTVRDLKAFSRVDEERRGPVDVREVLDASISMAGNEVRHRARLVKAYSEVPAVDASAPRLGQVFLNLIVNAAQSIPEGQASGNEIRAAVRLDGGRVVVEIRDTGCGIPPDVLGQVFDPFFTTKAIGVGTGLGLSICHGIISALGGEITVESEVGTGTVVRVLLTPAPTETTAPEPPSLARIPTPRSLRRGRVLIIDDDPPIGRALCRVLGWEHEVVVETSARAALGRLAAGEHFDVILCDLMMPELTGMDVHAELSDVSPAQAERLVFLTGGAFTPRALAFRERVSNPFIEKPFDLGALRAMVRTLVDSGERE